jgi:multicomponent Na+:H+ antiporter subunit C
VSHLPYLLAVWLFLVGLYGIVTSRNMIHLAVCLAVTQASTYVLILSIGYVKGGTAPIFFDVPVGKKTVDPVVASLVLTDIVVSVTLAALVLALASLAHEAKGTVDPDELPELKG